MTINYNPGIATSGLVFCIDAGNPRSYPGSGTTVYDTTTTQPVTSMINGVTYTSGTSGYWTMDGIDDYIGGNSLTTTLAGGTMEIWTYITAINRNQGFFALNSGVGYINFWMPSSNNMRWEVIGTTGSAYSTINATTTSVVNTWYHFVGTFNGSNNTTIYVNGTAETSQTMTNQPSGSYVAPIQVGRYDGSYPSASRISIARFYNRALSSAEVSQNFNASRGRYGI